MQCPNCGSPNINVQVVSNIFWKKSKGSDKMKFKNNTMAVCQNCGTTWEVK